MYIPRDETCTNSSYWTSENIAAGLRLLRPLSRILIVLLSAAISCTAIHLLRSRKHIQDQLSHIAMCLRDALEIMEEEVDSTAYLPHDTGSESEELLDDYDR